MAALPVTQRITYFVSGNGHLYNALVRDPNQLPVEMPWFVESLR